MCNKIERSDLTWGGQGGPARRRNFLILFYLLLGRTCNARKQTRECDHFACCQALWGRSDQVLWSQRPPGAGGLMWDSQGRSSWGGDCIYFLFFEKVAWELRSQRATGRVAVQERGRPAGAAARAQAWQRDGGGGGGGGGSPSGRAGEGGEDGGQEQSRSERLTGLGKDFGFHSSAVG